MNRVKPPFSWYGGKAFLAPLLVKLIPTHKCYVEVFGGAASVLLAKSKISEVEVYNDIDSGLVNFFRQLREYPKKLKKLLRRTPYSRQECVDCRDVVLTSKHLDVTPLEWARCWYVAASQSYGSVLGKASGWSYTKTKSHAKQWRKAIGRIDDIAFRLQGVLVDNLSFDEVIERYDAPGTFFYFDPPYIATTRVKQNSRNSYRFEMKERQHRVLVDMMLDMEGQGMLSGYEHPIYKRLETQGGWSRIELPTKTQMTTRLQTTDNERIEVLWLSPKVEHRRQRRGILV